MKRRMLFLDIWNASPVDENGCRVWAGKRRPDGYGSIGGGMAHRRVYVEFVGQIPEGMTVDHRCFRPDCVNPQHLTLLPAQVNRKRQQSALKTHCVNGHEYTEANTYHRRPRYRGGQRDCRTCRARRSMEQYAKSRAALVDLPIDYALTEHAVAAMDRIDGGVGR